MSSLSNTTWHVNSLFHTERLGDCWLALTAKEHRVYRLVGPAAEVLTRLAAGEATLPAHLDGPAEALASHGIIIAAGHPRRVGRRPVLLGGAAAALAVGIQTLRLPVAAAASSAFTYAVDGAASSVCLSTTGFREIVFNASGTFSVTEGSITATVIAIGGGGSGAVYRSEGTDGDGGGGGGGGGGEVVVDTITITPGTASAITVGQGGATALSGVPGNHTGPGNPGSETSALGVVARGGEGAPDGTGGASGSGQLGGVHTFNRGGGGGGGAGGAGGTGGGGLGGAGTTISVGGVSIAVGGGGGGAGDSPPDTRVAGGGTGQVSPGDPGTQVTGGTNGTGGGGGGAFSLGSSETTAGGSGRVVIRFEDPTCPVV
jgi:hypothetical protein